MERFGELPVWSDVGFPTPESCNIFQSGDSRMTRTIVMTGFVALLGLAGCNTVAGVGEDVRAGGAAIENTAESTKRQVTTY